MEIDFFQLAQKVIFCQKTAGYISWLESWQYHKLCNCSRWWRELHRAPPYNFKPQLFYLADACTDCWGRRWRVADPLRVRLVRTACSWCPCRGHNKLERTQTPAHVLAYTLWWRNLRLSDPSGPSRIRGCRKYNTGLTANWSNILTNQSSPVLNKHEDAMQVHRSLFIMHLISSESSFVSMGLGSLEIRCGCVAGCHT